MPSNEESGAMETVETRYEHIVLDERGVPLIAGTTTKVVELIASHQAYGWSAEELAYQYPYLTLGQIYSALAYYWDHKAELDEDMARRLAYSDEMRRRSPVPPVIERLRAIKKSNVPT
jgi:uncharacterized protein (DUF433 family)